MVEKQNHKKLTAVIIPKEIVMNVNQIRGPTTLTAIVAGNWKARLAIVYIIMEMD